MGMRRAAGCIRYVGDRGCDNAGRTAHTFRASGLRWAAIREDVVEPGRAGLTGEGASHIRVARDESRPLLHP